MKTDITAVYSRLQRLRRIRTKIHFDGFVPSVKMKYIDA